MQTLCTITDWTTTTGTRGKGKGNQITTRRVIAADNWNWILGTEKQGGNIVSEKFFGNIRSLFTFMVMNNEDVNVIATKVLSSLVEKNGDKGLAVGQQKTIKEWEKLGRDIDEAYNTSYFSPFPPTVLKTVFKAHEEDEEVVMEETEEGE